MAQSGGRGGKALNRVRGGTATTGGGSKGDGKKVPGGMKGEKNESNAFEKKAPKGNRKVG
jgi:hypothetical protein